MIFSLDSTDKRNVIPNNYIAYAGAHMRSVVRRRRTHSVILQIYNILLKNKKSVNNYSVSSAIIYERVPINRAPDAKFRKTNFPFRV